MDNTDYLWLVEIRIKDWHPLAGKTLEYVEVLARKGWCEGNEYARLAGMNEIERLAQYAPAFKLKMALLNLDVTDLCAPDAVIIEEN